MSYIDREGVRRAVRHLLTDSPEAQQTYQAVRKYIDLYMQEHEGPVLEVAGDNLTPEAASLAYLYTQSARAFYEVLNLVNAERLKLGLLPLRKNAQDMPRSEYQANYMHAYRDAPRRFFRLWWMQYPESLRPVGEAREAWIANVRKRWSAYQRQQANLARMAKRGRLTQHELAAIKRDTEELIEEELALLEEFVHEEISKPTSQRNPNGFKMLIVATDWKKP